MNIEENNFLNSYRLSDDIIKSLEVLGYRTSTRIRQSTIPLMLSGNNMSVKAPTGSGKAAAFGTLVCEHAAWEENLPQVPILEPTRGLTKQVRDELFLTGWLRRLRVVAVYGGFPTDKQIRTLKRKPHMTVETPERLIDYAHRETLKPNKVSRVVIDEADLVLDIEFADGMRETLSELPQSMGIFLFSATLESEVCQLTDGFIQGAVTVTCDAQPEEEAAIRQLFYETASEDKYDTSIKILRLESPGNAIISCGTREMVNTLLQKLRRNRIFCGMSRGEMEQKERLKAVNAFHRDGFKFLIATDVAARGIDFKDITYVINYDFPAGRGTYVHRIRRTGKNGETGTAVSLVYEDDRWMLEMTEKHISRAFYVEGVPIPEHGREKAFQESQRVKTRSEDRDGNGFSKDIMRLAIGGRRKSRIRTNDIVATICTVGGMDVTDIGIISVGGSPNYMEILNQKGEMVLDALRDETLKGKVRKVRSVKVQGLT